MSVKTKSSGRRKLLINPHFQFQFMAWMGGLSIAVITVMHLSHYWFFFKLREQARMAGLSQDHVFYRFVQDRQTDLNLITGISFIAVLAIVGVLGLILSHKIAGPMYRLRLHFEEVGKTGTHKRFSFRQGDFFLEIPEAYNSQFKDGKDAEKSDADQNVA